MRSADSRDRCDDVPQFCRGRDMHCVLLDSVRRRVQRMARLSRSVGCRVPEYTVNGASMKFEGHLLICLLLFPLFLYPFRSMKFLEIMHLFSLAPRNITPVPDYCLKSTFLSMTNLFSYVASVVQYHAFTSKHMICKVFKVFNPAFTGERLGMHSRPMHPSTPRILPTHTRQSHPNSSGGCQS